MGNDKERTQIVADIAAKPDKKGKKDLAAKDDNVRKLDKFKAMAEQQRDAEKSKKKTKQSKDERNFDEAPPAKKQKLTKEEAEEFAIYCMYKDMTNDALQDILRYVRF